jgi:8-oxo-dGTP pyrophosphatase MutT (NUDIX family)
MNPGGELLFVRTRRFPDHWQSLGGGIEPDDKSARDAATREAKEEAGIEIRPEDIVHLCDAPYDFGEGTVYAFVAWVRGDVGLSINGTEIAEVQWLPLADALNLPMFPAMRCVLRSLALKRSTLKIPG